MDRNTSAVRPVPMLVTLILFLAAVAGVGSLFVDGPLAWVLRVFALTVSALYFVDRHRASKAARR